MPNYYLFRRHHHQRYTLSRYRLKDGENVGPIADYQEAKQRQAELNAAIPPRQRKPGAGRPGKPHVLHNMKIRADLSARLVKEARDMGQSVTAVVERLIETNISE